MKLDEMIGMRDGRRVTKGSFVRTLRQAERNLIKSVYTIILAIHMGLVTPGASSALVRISEMVAGLKETSPTPEETSRIVGALEVLARRLTEATH